MNFPHLVERINESRNLPTGTHLSRFPSSLVKVNSSVPLPPLCCSYTLCPDGGAAAFCSSTTASVASLPLTFGFLHFEIVVFKIEFSLISSTF